MGQPTLEVQMIVKNEAAHLARCIESLSGAADRILIGDTGSEDETIEVARDLGAEVIGVRWNNDFAEARNEVLRHGSCDWVLIVDPDEMLDLHGPACLRDAIQHTEIAGYDVTRWHYMAATNSRSGEQGAVKNPGLLQCSLSFPAYTTTVNTRLFQRLANVYFERPVHETVAYRLRSLGLPTAPAPFIIHHFGHVEGSTKDRERKNELYSNIGLRYLQEHPRDTIARFEVGLTQLEHFKNPEVALALFLEALHLDPRDWRAAIYAGVCLNRLGKYSEAILHLESARKIHAGSIVLHETLGDSHFHKGDYQEALIAYTAARDLGCASGVVMAKVGICQIFCGKLDEGMRALRHALEMESGSAEILDLVVGGAAIAGEYEFGAAMARQRLLMPCAEAAHYVVASTLLRVAGQSEVGKEVIEAGAAKFEEEASIAAERARYQ